MKHSNEMVAVAPLKEAARREISGVVARPSSLEIERAKQRNQKAMQDFLGRYWKPLHNYFRYNCHWQEQFVPDLVQEVNAKALRSFPRFRGATEAQARAWLFGIARHVHLQEVSRQVGIRLRADVARDLEALRTQSASCSHHGVNSQLRVRLKRALSELPLPQLEVLRLVIEGHSTNEVAEQLGVAPGTVASRAHRARKRLKELLGNEFWPTHHSHEEAAC